MVVGAAVWAQLEASIHDCQLCGCRCKQQQWCEKSQIDVHVQLKLRVKLTAF